MAVVHGKTGRVYGNALLVEDCEDTWNETVVAGVTLSTTTGKVGSAARATTVGIGATTLLMSEAITVDLTAYKSVLFWVRSSVNTSAGDLRLQLDDTASCASPLENLQIPALTANTWKLCVIRFADPSLLGSIISIGLYQNANLADGTFDIDGVYALKEVAGITDWTLVYDMDTPNSTTFQQDGVSTFVAGVTKWSGSFKGFKDGVPLSLSTAGQTYLALDEGYGTAGQTWSGAALIRSLSTSTNINSLVAYDYAFQGTGDLQVPIA